MSLRPSAMQNIPGLNTIVDQYRTNQHVSIDTPAHGDVYFIKRYVILFDRS